MNINLDDYKIIDLVDCTDNNIKLGTILLNVKHDIKDFQKAIYDAKIKHQEEIIFYGDDWQFIEQELEDFDYIEFNLDADDYVEY